MGPRSAVVIAGLVAAWRIRRTIVLRRDEVHAQAAPEDVFERLRTQMLASGDVVAGDSGGAVVRFSGRAGPFRYRTVEAVHFSGTTATFEHLNGPFDQCRETIRVGPGERAGTEVTHDGELVMRGGLIGWCFGIAVVRPLFERHVADHLRALAADDDSP